MVLTFWKDQRGQDTIEYALILAFIATAAAAASPAALAVAAYLGRSMAILQAALTATAQ